MEIDFSMPERFFLPVQSGVRFYALRAHYGLFSGAGAPVLSLIVEQADPIDSGRRLSCSFVWDPKTGWHDMVMGDLEPSRPISESLPVAISKIGHAPELAQPFLPFLENPAGLLLSVLVMGS